MRAALVTVLILAASSVSACARVADHSGADYVDQLRARVTTDAVFAHLRQLQHIADEHNGTRQTGTPGYTASVDYVVSALTARGFDIQTPEFEMGVFHVDSEALSVNGAPLAAHAVEYSGASPAAGVTGPVVVAPDDDTPGCQAADYDGLPIAGAVAVVTRGACYLADKAAAATERGAIGLVIINDADEKAFSGAFLETDQVKIPAVSVSKADGPALRARAGVAKLVVVSRTEHVRARNVIATTRSGSRDDTVMAGAHLDSVRRGPGIDDNGSGVAAILEIALQMGSTPPVPNAVSFAFWGGEEEWLIGSTSYVKSLDLQALKDIALYLNFDMVGSPNAGYFTLDGDASTPPDPELGGTPAGSAGIEKAFVDALARANKTARDLEFDGRGDYSAFATTGIPVGQLFTGSEEVKTVEEARLWGGQAGVPFDPNYHTPDDTIDNVNRDVIDVTLPIITDIVGHYAQDVHGTYGVPGRAERNRQPLVE
jgi:Zn-dependent M28 family amino/carboxypeptidase